MRKWLFVLFVTFFCIFSATVWAQESTPNRVLSLDGDGDYVEVTGSENLNDVVSRVTVEIWMRFTAFTTEWISLINSAHATEARSCL